MLYSHIEDKIIIVALCAEIDEFGESGEINKEEWIALHNHFISQKPNEHQHSEFTKHPNWIGGNIWWDEQEIFNPVNRKAFIRKIIKTLEDEELQRG